MKTSSPISKNKTQYLDSQKTSEKSTNNSYKTNINTILKQDNHTGTNTHHKFHGKNYGKKPTHTIGHKITTYSTYSYIINDIL